MTNVFEAVDQNKRKSFWVVILFTVVVAVASYFIGSTLNSYWGYEGSGLGLAGVALIISGFTSFVSYYWSDRLVLSLSGATPANRKDHFEFYTVCENLCLAANIPMPKLFILEDTALNAFATGRNPQHAAICATSGLLKSLNRTELEAVIGHELSHIANYDTRLMSLVTVMVGTLTLLADWFLRMGFHSSRNDSEKSSNFKLITLVLGILFALLSPVVAQLIQLAISRRREFLADASSVKLTRQPGGLISALQKLGKDTEALEAANKATAHLYISDPLKNNSSAISWFSKLFLTHPPLSERIEALQAMR
jgi:heat shock protein HtpX